MNEEIFDIEKTTEEFFHSFETGSREAMQNTLAENLKSYITNAEGGVFLLNGRDVFIDNIEALDVKTVKPEVNITQMTRINQNQTMTMIEIKAKRKGKSLHNFAAFLFTFEDGLINEIRMVEALPAYSDEFWKS